MSRGLTKYFMHNVDVTKAPTRGRGLVAPQQFVVVIWLIILFIFYICCHIIDLFIRARSRRPGGSYTTSYIFSWPREWRSLRSRRVRRDRDFLVSCLRGVSKNFRQRRAAPIMPLPRNRTSRRCEIWSLNPIWTGLVLVSSYAAINS